MFSDVSVLLSMPCQEISFGTDRFSHRFQMLNFLGTEYSVTPTNLNTLIVYQ